MLSFGQRFGWVLNGEMARGLMRESNVVYVRGGYRTVRLRPPATWHRVLGEDHYQEFGRFPPFWVKKQWGIRPFYAILWAETMGNSAISASVFGQLTNLFGQNPASGQESGIRGQESGMAGPGSGIRDLVAGWWVKTGLKPGKWPVLFTPFGQKHRAERIGFEGFLGFLAQDWTGFASFTDRPTVKCGSARAEPSQHMAGTSLIRGHLAPGRPKMSFTDLRRTEGGFSHPFTRREGSSRL